ncbi:MAG TPA: protein kinase, partial [Pirellulaceae bacterium]|nr:protein kinase [Pirellulaceae bacterium]
MNAAPFTAETLPELARLAYDDYRAARQRGETVVPAEFCSRYPEACRYELQRLISVHLALVDEHPSWLAEIHEQFSGGETPWPEVGQVWLGFELLSELGRGGLARVYLASELAAGCRQVVLKVTPRETAEAHLLGKLAHENIVPVWTVRRDEETGLWAVVMPYLGKATLHDVRIAAMQAENANWEPDLIRRVAVEKCGGDRPARAPDRMAVRELEIKDYLGAVVVLGRQLADALAYTHSQGILHRDLKPSNVLVTPGGQALLIDFNLSTSVDGADIVLGGTVPYMPPESLTVVAAGLASHADGEQRNSVAPDVVRGCAPTQQAVDLGCDWEARRRDGRDQANAPTVRAFGTARDSDLSDSRKDSRLMAPDRRSDLFSLAAILYELLLGRPPFGDVDPLAPLATQVRQMLEQQQQRRPFSTAETGFVPEELAAILQRCLRLAPEERPESANELAGALQSFLDRRYCTAGPQPCDQPIVSTPEAATNTTTASGPSRSRSRRLAWYGGAAAVALSLVLTLAATVPPPLDTGWTASASRPSANAPQELRELPVTSQIEPEADTVRTQAYAAIARGDWETATVQLAAAIRAEPEAADLQAALGYCFNRLGEPRRAIAHYEKALELSPHSTSYVDATDLLNNLVYCRLSLGRRDAALAAADRALEFANRHGSRRAVAVARYQRALCRLGMLESSFLRGSGNTGPSGNSLATSVLGTAGATGDSTPTLSEDARAMWDDFEAAREHWDGSLSFHYDAARGAEVMRARTGESQWSQVSKLELRRALALGLDPDFVTRSAPRLAGLVATLVDDEAESGSPTRRRPSPEERLCVPAWAFP